MSAFQRVETARSRRRDRTSTRSPPSRPPERATRSTRSPQPESLPQFPHSALDAKVGKRAHQRRALRPEALVDVGMSCSRTQVQSRRSTSGTLVRSSSTVGRGRAPCTWIDMREPRQRADDPAQAPAPSAPGWETAARSRGRAPPAHLAPARAGRRGGVKKPQTGAARGITGSSSSRRCSASRRSACRCSALEARRGQLAPARGRRPSSAPAAAAVGSESRLSRSR